MLFWNSDSQTVLHTAELSINSLGILYCFGILISRQFSTQRSFLPIPWGDIVVFCNSDFHTVCIHSGAFNQFPGDVVVFWNSDFQTVFHTAERPTNSLRDVVVFWNFDFHSVLHTAELSTNALGFCCALELLFPDRFPHSGAFNQFHWILWCLGIMISRPFSTRRKVAASPDRAPIANQIIPINSMANRNHIT